jgi:DNA-binding NarL/FixJ family response regulator
MKPLTLETKQQEMEWRRSKVLELSSQGYSEKEISEILKINDTAVQRFSISKTSSPGESAASCP